MKFALVNPAWRFEGSTYFGCRDAHYPLELLFAHDQIIAAGHDALVIDAQTDNLSPEQVRGRLNTFAADFLVIPTAPSYLFWRCPPPELRVPIEWFAALGDGLTKVAIGPHSSATPAATLHKTGCDVAMRGEPDLFPFPGTPSYIETFGAMPDDRAWEWAHHYYTQLFSDRGFSDIQEQKPLPIEQLESAEPAA